MPLRNIIFSFVKQLKKSLFFSPATQHTDETTEISYIKKLKKITMFYALLCSEEVVCALSIAGGIFILPSMCFCKL